MTAIDKYREIRNIEIPKSPYSDLIDALINLQNEDSVMYHKIANMFSDTRIKRVVNGLIERQIKFERSDNKLMDALSIATSNMYKYNEIVNARKLYTRYMDLESSFNLSDSEFKRLYTPEYELYIIEVVSQYIISYQDYVVPNIPLINTLYKIIERLKAFKTVESISTIKALIDVYHEDMHTAKIDMLKTCSYLLEDKLLRTYASAAEKKFIEAADDILNKYTS